MQSRLRIAYELDRKLADFYYWALMGTVGAGKRTSNSEVYGQDKSASGPI
jgi:Fe-S cluster assembly ATPase SufC